MITFPNTLRTALFASTLALAGCGGMMMKTASASTTNFGATLSGSAEVPPTASAGTGSMEATLDTSTSVLRWKVTYSGLSGPATAGHFHGPAMAGANAGVAVPFANPASPIEGQTTLTAAQMADLMAGRWYVNVHTAASPGGEIRGQVMEKK